MGWSERGICDQLQRIWQYLERQVAMREHLIGRKPFEDLAFELLGLDHRFDEISYWSTNILFSDEIVLRHATEKQRVQPINIISIANGHGRFRTSTFTLWSSAPSGKCQRQRNRAPELRLLFYSVFG